MRGRAARSHSLHGDDCFSFARACNNARRQHLFAGRKQTFDQRRGADQLNPVATKCTQQIYAGSIGKAQMRQVQAHCVPDARARDDRAQFIDPRAEQLALQVDGRESHGTPLSDSQHDGYSSYVLKKAVWQEEGKQVPGQRRSALAAR